MDIGSILGILLGLLLRRFALDVKLYGSGLNESLSRFVIPTLTRNIGLLLTLRVCPAFFFGDLPLLLIFVALAFGPSLGGIGIQPFPY